MRATPLRRTAAAAAVACLALLATACGGDESADAGAAQDKATAEESATTSPAAEVLTTAELEKLALADKDVEGHTVEKAATADIPDAEEVSVENAACEPLAYAVNALPVGEPAAKAQRIVRSEPTKPSDEELAEMSPEEQLAASMNVVATAASLFSYEDSEAEEAVAALRTAAEKCADGFAGTTDGEEDKVTKIAEESFSGGDEAAAWTVTREGDGETLPYKLVVVRQGNTLATFSSTNFGAALSGKDFGLPTAVIDAQLAKLG
ncbi:hypothetical protein [Streptomyces sp. NPDC002845]